MNTIFTNCPKFLAGTFLLLCLNACTYESGSHDASVEQMANQNAHRIDSGDRKKINTKNDTHSLVKPGAPVSLGNKQPLTAATPGTYEYRLQLLSPVDKGKMAVSVTADDGITIVSSPQHFEFSLQEGAEYWLPLTIHAYAEGRFYIQLQVSIFTDGQSSSRVIAAILQIGESVKMQKAAAKSTRETTEGIISLPAQESISPR